MAERLTLELARANILWLIREVIEHNAEYQHVTPEAMLRAITERWAPPLRRPAQRRRSAPPRKR